MFNLKSTEFSSSGFHFSSSLHSPGIYFWKDSITFCGAKQPIAELDLAANREAQKHNGRIVECCWDRVHMKWMFMRLREDKSFPNSYTTAQSECTAQLSTIEPLLFFPVEVCMSIRQPVTKEWLLEVVEKHRWDLHRC